MKIQLYENPWAIVPSVLRKISSIDASVFGEFIAEEEGKTIISREGSTGILDISGPITHRFSLDSAIFGGVSSIQIQRDFTELLYDESVTKIVLKIDSPGGEVAGGQETADLIYRSRGIKPIVAYVNSMCCSLAYWIASAADEVALSSITDEIGSVGVVCLHQDISGMEKNAGVKTTEIFSGKYKRIASHFEPLSDAGKDAIQQRVSYLHSIFVEEALVRNRGIEHADLEKVAEGQVLIGQQAVPLLADKIGKMGEDSHKEDSNLDIATLKEKHPDLYTSVVDSAVADGVEKGVVAGIEKERERIKAVKALAIPGFENVISLAIDSGDTPEKTALAIIAEQQKRGPVTIDKLRSDSVSVAPAPVVDGKEEDEKRSVVEHMVAGAKSAQARWIAKA